jgi:hypothetical protein
LERDPDNFHNRHRAESLRAPLELRALWKYLT